MHRGRNVARKKEFNFLFSVYLCACSVVLCVINEVRRSRKVPSHCEEVIARQSLRGSHCEAVIARRHAEANAEANAEATNSKSPSPGTQHIALSTKH